MDADSMRRYLEMAMEDASVCSNDPVCSDVTVKPPAFNGAACYACAFLPETSCEHKNTWLDRRLLWHR
jgi:hypothetical protein